VHYEDLREESHKSWQHSVSDEIVYLPEAVFGLNKGIGISDRIAPAEIYRNGDAWVELQFVLVGERGAHYVAIIESLNSDVLPCSFGKVNQDFPSVGRNPPVLVEVTHSVEPPQGMSFVGCPSVIRLKRFDLSDGIVRDILDLGCPPLDVPVGLRQMREDRELSAVSGEFRNLERQVRQTPDQLIQGGSHTVERIADDQTRGVRDIVMPEAKDVPLSFQIIITLKGIWLSFRDEPLKFNIEGVKMYLRPTKFQIGIEESGHIPNNVSQFG
jgi:hypothetical protein